MGLIHSLALIDLRLSEVKSVFYKEFGIKTITEKSFLSDAIKLWNVAPTTIKKYDFQSSQKHFQSDYYDVLTDYLYQTLFNH